MTSNLEKFNKELDTLLETANLLYNSLEFDSIMKHGIKKKYKKRTLDFSAYYEIWYSEALEVIRQILPNRLNDFKELYKIDKKKKIDHSNYTICEYIAKIKMADDDWLTITEISSSEIISKFRQQRSILESAKKRFSSSLFDIKEMVCADFFNSEIEKARELHKNGFLRPAGAIVGVILEKHLEQISKNHNIYITKKDPTISDYNDLLKKQGVIDISIWRSIQYLGDLRNLCDHNKGREPEPTEVSALIDGVEKITKTVH